MEKHYLFIGGVWDNKNEKKIIANSKGAIQSAANNLQWEIIKGLEIASSSIVSIINSIFIGAFPKGYKKLFIKSFTFNHSNESNKIDYNVGFLNFPIIKHYSKYIREKKYIKKVLKSTDGEIYVLGYSMTYAVVKGLLYAKKFNRNVKTCLIVPDLPEFMYFGKRKLIFDIVKKLSNNILYKDIKSIDSFIVLTDEMFKKLDVGKKNYVVVEGIAPEIEMSPSVIVEDTSVKRILYTGSLSAKYGICDLVDAFIQIDDSNLQLTICGYGDGETYIKEMAKKDARIEFLGTLDVKKVRELQKSAYLLVNPRNNNEEYTKYSFPSKTLEYMMSGRPVLMYHLDGIPEEYDDYIYYINKDIKSSLQEILKLSKDELEQKGIAARQFVKNKKNKEMQAAKIISMLNEV